MQALPCGRHRRVSGGRLHAGVPAATSASAIRQVGGLLMRRHPAGRRGSVPRAGGHSHFLGRAGPCDRDPRLAPPPAPPRGACREEEEGREVHAVALGLDQTLLCLAGRASLEECVRYCADGMAWNSVLTKLLQKKKFRHHSERQKKKGNFT